MNENTQTLPAYFLKVKDVPDMVKSVLNHEATADFNAEIAEKHVLSDVQGRALAHIVQSLIIRDLPPKDLPARVEKDLLLDPKAAKSVALDLLGLRCLPLEWYLGPVQPVIRNLGGDPEAYLKRIRPIYPEVYANGPLLTAPEPDPDDPMTKWEAEVVSATPPTTSDNVIPDPLVEFESKVQTFSGKAEVLLRLSAYGTRIEDAMAASQIDARDGQQLLADLDSVASAINTHDLNPFEIQALKKKVSRVVSTVQTKIR